MTYQTPVFEQHAAALVGSKMVVFGGDSGDQLLDDTKVMRFWLLCVGREFHLSTTIYLSTNSYGIHQILNLEKLTWDSVAPKVRPSPNRRPSKLPACKGHCLVYLLYLTAVGMQRLLYFFVLISLFKL